jgi:hypothetical protein
MIPPSSRLFTPRPPRAHCILVSEERVTHDATPVWRSVPSSERARSVRFNFLKNTNSLLKGGSIAMIREKSANYLIFLIIDMFHLVA